MIWRVLASSLGDEDRRAGLVEALEGASWALSALDPVSVEIDRQLKIAEQAWTAASRKPQQLA